MTNLPHDFNRLAEPKTEKKPAPFSLRLSFGERTRLEQDAGDKPLGAYIRERLFGKDAKPRKGTGKRPIKDQQALGRVLGALGRSRLASNLNQLAKAVNTGSLPVTPDTEKEIREACKAVTDMRDDLRRALGRNPEGGP
ncbi:hypothetical protein [Microbaculum marinisediminis]|uniref:Mobilisation protein (MobC) n=1 Tax=Microbaculum marinisediminis TaxID=2931392 RepID=A0AAW5QRU8_9HYPH|nr:hypothetical protein [Microbaculum sp. A6E488]MCT8970781.1 hypothetical protein [Microbaculum sp. A6E488]